jgi:AGCS family alanine or glycine:cation symporter
MEALYNGLLYLTGWPLAAVLILGGLYFTVRTGFVQLRLLKEAINVILEKPAVQGSVSSFGALMISTASQRGYR